MGDFEIKEDKRLWNQFATNFVGFENPEEFEFFTCCLQKFTKKEFSNETTQKAEMFRLKVKKK